MNTEFLYFSSLRTDFVGSCQFGFAGVSFLTLEFTISILVSSSMQRLFRRVGVSMLSHFRIVPLYDPKDCSLPGSSVHEISQARTLEWVAMPSSRGSS